MPQTLDPHIAKLVRDARTQAGMTQQELSYATGVTQDCISRIENGFIPHLKTLIKLAHATGCELNITFDITQV